MSTRDLEPFRGPVITLVVARSSNHVIGVNGTLPWHISTDLKRFKALTVGKAVVMGRKTYESIGKPLPRRTNIVVTRDQTWSADGVIVAHDLPGAIALAYEDAHRTGVNDVMVIGGSEIYRQALPEARRIYLTEVHRDYKGDTTFDFDSSEWTEISRERHDAQTSDGPAFSFVTLEKRLRC